MWNLRSARPRCKGDGCTCANLRYHAAMNIRKRKFIGIVAMIAYITVYALVAMAVGGHFVVGGGMAKELATFIALGVLWLPGAMWIITWMSRPDPI